MDKRRTKAPAPKLAAGTDAVPPGVPAPPPWLDDEGRAEWARIAPTLHAAGRLGDADAPALALYCDAFSRYQVARESLRLEGPTLNSDLGGVKANPAAAVVKEAAATMTKILAQFGCTPADRKRIGAVATTPKANPFAAFKAKYGR